METKGLVVTRASEGQIVYASTELASTFLDSLENPYLNQMTNRANWAVSALDNWGPKSFLNVFNAAFGRWSAEFQIADISLREA